MMIVLAFMLMSCEKHELTVDEYLSCQEIYDNSYNTNLSLVNSKKITWAEFNKRMEQADKDYDKCLETGRNNK